MEPGLWDGSPASLSVEGEANFRIFGTVPKAVILKLLCTLESTGMLIKNADLWAFSEPTESNLFQ